MLKILLPITKINKESLTTKLTLIIIGLTAGSALLVPATYASFHPVTSGEIADGTIQSVDIANGQVRTEDIGTGQVRTGDILDGQVYSVDIRNGQVGSADIANDAIRPNIVFLAGNRVVISPGFERVATVDCPAGFLVTGGGFWGSDSLIATQSRPDDHDTWEVTAINRGASDQDISAVVVCLGPMP